MHWTYSRLIISNSECRFEIWFLPPSPSPSTNFAPALFKTAVTCSSWFWFLYLAPLYPSWLFSNHLFPLFSACCCSDLFTWPFAPLNFPLIYAYSNTALTPWQLIRASAKSLKCKCKMPSAGFMEHVGSSPGRKLCKINCICCVIYLQIRSSLPHFSRWANSIMNE